MNVPVLPPLSGETRAASTTAPALVFDLAAAGGLDLDRLERALELAAERVGPGRYRVKGGAHEHWVDLWSAAHPRCDCGDHLWREATCKHILAALLREGDPRVVAGVGQVMQRLRERVASVTAVRTPKRAA